MTCSSGQGEKTPQLLGQIDYFTPRDVVVRYQSGSLTSLLLTMLIAAAYLCVPARADNRVALVIGNSTYRNVTRLDNPKNDAKLMAETLRGLGFTLAGGSAQIDLDKAAFDDILQQYSNLLVGADVALFYYAGHGVQVRGSNYLVPVNANPVREADVLFQMVDTALILAAMEGSGTKLNIVILDACRNNPFGGRGLRSAAGGLAQMQAPEGTLISYATQPGNVALDDTGGHSPYTKALAQTIRKPGLGIFDTFNQVGVAVMQATGNAQQPWVSTSPIKESFQFATSGAQVPAAPSPSAATSEAAQVWGTIQNTTSIAVLQTFVDRFSDTLYGSMGRARLEELKKYQAATANPPATDRNPVSATSHVDMPGAYEPNMDRAGITIAEQNLPGPDARLCQSLCINEPRCTAWVYRAPEGRTDGRPHCWLRNNVIRRPGDNATISGDVQR